MKKNVTFAEFSNDLIDNFSYQGARTLLEYLENLEDETGTEIEYDHVAICCEFAEYENLEVLQSDYPDIQSMEELEDQTTVIMIDDESFIIQVF
jgi:hypothetical protein